MTLAQTDPGILRTEADARAASGTGALFLLALLAVLLMSLPNLVDPFIRHDDYPAYFADPAGFWDKTLHEGRWVNYLWHLREIVTPAWLNFAVYQALWACFAASLAVAALGRSAVGFFGALLVGFVLVAPPASLIALWFNTLLPGMALVALYAVLANRLSVVAHRALLPLFVILTFMAYTTFPVLLLAICLVRTRRRSLADLAGLWLLFVASFAAAVLTTYAINWQVHGVFGVPLADWRQANPADSLSDLRANLPLVAESLSAFLHRTSFEFVPAIWFHLGLLAVSTAVLLRRAPLEALYLHAGLATGLALVVAQVLKLGVEVPPRAFIFAWVFYGLIAVRAAQMLGDGPGLAGRLVRNAVILVAASYMLQTATQFASYRAWQGETRALSTLLEGVRGPVLVDGDPMKLASARRAFVQTRDALGYRMQQVRGRGVARCAAPDCADAVLGRVTARTDLPGGLHLRLHEGGAVLRIP
ncbi:hypothetical protein KUH32_09465 [Thalassococcus sp. CAU 1522]|uniref:Glycosyltransferase RgtA/B/C/D-like domain-containing protein n=1 Tax=Thalassococcus arenae TaxID=2851652 RepID=A0ABS6N7M6_9RHOB|nr:hypothetical protein [Thalassococcus arenae]MBV2360003.1 hypothetical protein [Thalassococcus arenae]